MSLKPIRLSKLLVFVLITELAGFLGNMLAGDQNAVYKTIVRPPLSPPMWVFPVVWIILYLLIGIAAYILNTEGKEAAPLLKIYWIQLAINALWPLIFWRFGQYTLGAFIIGIIIILTAILFVKSFSVNRTAAWLFLPYLLWLIFALYLNIGIAMLN